MIPVNEPGFGSQWGLRNLSGPDIEATHAWSITRGSSSIKIGIVDTGIGSNNPDLSGKVTVVGTTVIDNHGTHVAGIAAARGENSGGRVVGVDWNAQIVSGQLSDAVGTTNAINAVVAAGARVVNNSWGTATRSTTLTNSLTSAYQGGVLLVHANPYDNTTDPDLISNYPNDVGPWILNVGAMTQAGNAYINTGSRFFTDVGAPGDNVYSTYPGSNWGSQPGTSMAAPFVTGTASLMLAANGNLRNYDLEHILKWTAQRYHLGWDSRIGYGMINAYAALQKVTAPNTVTHGNASFIRRYTNTSTSFVNGPLPGLAAGTYYSDIYELSATASYSYNGTPWAWLAVTDKGYSAANPNDASRWMQESVTSTSMSLKTFFYYIRTNSAGQPSTNGRRSIPRRTSATDPTSILWWVRPPQRIPPPLPRTSDRSTVRAACRGWSGTPAPPRT